MVRKAGTHTFKAGVIVVEAERSVSSRSAWDPKGWMDGRTEGRLTD